MSSKELEKIFNDNYNKYIDIINNKTKVKINDYYNIQNMIIFSFYILIEPVRSSEIASLKYQNYDINNDNYIDIKNKSLIFNDFKTSKTKNQLIIDLKQNKKLINLIKSFILFKQNNGFNRDYLFNSNDDTNIDNSQLAKRLNHIIGKNISSSMIRKIYLSDKYNDTLETINNINKSAKNMMNSTNVITKNYIKTN
jgi:integrase